MFIPGALIGALTFPGIMMHEFLHKKLCDWQKVKVHEVKYFTWESDGMFQDRMGYVVHSRTTFWKQTWIGLAPLLGIIPGFITLYLSLFLELGIFNYLLFWLGFSILVNMFPSRVDIDHYFKEIKIKKNIFEFGLYILLLPLVLVLYIISYLQVFWIDFVIAFFIFAWIVSLPGIADTQTTNSEIIPQTSSQIDPNNLIIENEPITNEPTFREEIIQSFTYDGNNASLIQEKIYDKMNEFRKENSYSSFNFNSNYQGSAEYQVKKLAQEGYYDFEYSGDQGTMYGYIPYYSNVEGCGSTINSDGMISCMFDSIKFDVLDSDMKTIGFALYYDSNSENMYYFITY